MEFTSDQCIAAPLSKKRSISGGILGPDGNYADTLRYGSCTHETLPLWEVTADLEGGDRGDPALASILGEDFEVLRDLRMVQYSQVRCRGRFRAPSGADPVGVLNWLFFGETPLGASTLAECTGGC